MRHLLAKKIHCKGKNLAIVYSTVALGSERYSSNEVEQDPDHLKMAMEEILNQRLNASLHFSNTDGVFDFLGRVLILPDNSQESYHSYEINHEGDHFKITFFEAPL